MCLQQLHGRAVLEHGTAWAPATEGSLVHGVPVTLVCIPHAGGGASTYGRWPDAFAPRVKVCTVQLPGRESRYREPLLRDLNGAVADLFAQTVHLADRPFALFGHSMGGLLAFELARRLRDELGREPVRLYISACRAPGLRQVDPPLTHLADGEFTAELARRYGGIPAAILADADYMAAVLPAIRSDFTILENYRSRDGLPLSCPITAFGADEDRVIPLSALPGWRSETTGEFSLKIFPGDHFYHQSARLALADHILRDLPQPAEAKA